MSNYPTSLDDDISISRVDNNITEIGGDAINALRDAVFAIEGELGLSPSGTAGSVANRLGVSLDSAGNIKSSALTALGLVTLPITNVQISATAAIKESKLALDYSTASLFTTMNNINTNLDSALNFITYHGSKIEPHIQGSNYRHVMNHIDIDSNVNNYFKNRNGAFRDNTNLYNLFNDFNKDLVSHEKADSTNFGNLDPTSTSVGTIPPVNYAHVSSGIYLNTSNFTYVPQTATDLQQFAQFIDNSNIFILGTRIQNLYQNGVSRASRSTSLTDSSHGDLIVPITAATSYLVAFGSAPFDDISQGDDVVQFTPASGDGYLFNSQFSRVKAGDILTINYGSVTVSFVIREVKNLNNGSISKYYVRITGKNLLATTHAVAQINKPLFNTEKYGVLTLAQAYQSIAPLSSVIVGHPRGAEVLGNGFNPELIDSTHYKLYLVLYPSGNPANGSVSLAGIDISGNAGATPGQYTLDSIVSATNNAFRYPGFNYRFIAYSYQGNFGIMLADSIGGASFSIISSVINVSGAPDQNLTSATYPVSVIDIFNNKDALGLGPNGANVASPPYSATFVNVAASRLPTKVFTPLTRKTFYVNGVERDRLNIEQNQDLDLLGDGYWPAFVEAVVDNLSSVNVTYQINRDLTSSGLEVGKTIVIQPEGSSGTSVDSGRFVIQSVSYNSCNCDGYSSYAQITVTDGIHGTGVSPSTSATVGTNLRVYFSSDSVGFNKQNVSDQDASNTNVYKRHMEILINQDGYTFSQERGRMGLNGTTIYIDGDSSSGIPLVNTAELSKINIYKISPKLRGFTRSNVIGSISVINLCINSYDSTKGFFDGYLWDGTNPSSKGINVSGKSGNIVRFYDNTGIDYIDCIFNLNDTVNSFTNGNVDIQLFKSLSLDDELMLLGTVQVNTATNILSYLRDERSFGNISENQLSTSALDYIAASTKLLNENGIIRGFDIVQSPTGVTPYLNTLTINGGTAIVNGKVIQKNNETIAIPILQESIGAYLNSTITWFICVNDNSEFELVASTDYDPNNSSVFLYTTTGLDHTRIFKVKNPNAFTPLPYNIRGSFLSNIISELKDLVVIGVITTTVAVTSGSTYNIVSAPVLDARRYIYNGYSGLKDAFVLGNNANFKTFDSLNVWLNNLCSYVSSQNNPNNIGYKVIVKSNFTISQTYTLNYNKEVIFEGNGGSFIIPIATGFNITKNVSFKNITVNYTYDPDASLDTSFNDGYYANPLKGAFYCNVTPIVSLNSAAPKNITFDNCTFTTPNVHHFPFIGFSLQNTSCFLENVNIINNKFVSTYTGSSTDGYRQAIITFIGPPALPPSTSVGARITNVNISNNYCNYDQMIMISSMIDIASGQILDLIAAVNLKITNNVCGVINILVKTDLPADLNLQPINVDKNNGTIISGNTCKLICTGYASGLVFDGLNTDPINKFTNRLFSGSLIIKDNSCSYIYISYRESSSGIEPVMNIIKDNKLRPLNFSFYGNYFNFVNSFNIAITLNKLSGA